jgi:iron complex outermembrane receptor protein
MPRKSNANGPKLGRLSIPVALALMLGSGLAGASDPPQAARYAIEQPSQDLGDALRAIARQTNTSVLFDPRVVSGRTSKAVSGQMSGIEAITAAIEGAGLQVQVTQEGAVVVKPAEPAAAPAGSAPMPMRPAATQADDGVSTASAGDARPGTKQAEGESVEALTRVEVTGSRLKRIYAEGPTPVNVYTRQEIERSGQPTLQRFLAGLNEVSASAGEGGFGATLGQGAVQMRGLPLGSTLVLINGRRVQAVGSSSGNFFNLNLIPMAAIERVEIVPVGSSAVYGGDALAGVVNVILKKSLDGQALTAQVGSGRGVSDGSLSLATGGRSAEGSYVLMGSYSRSTPLTMSERAFFANADYRPQGGTDTRSRSCTPGTVSSSTGGNLPGLDASFAGIPQAAGSPLQISDFAASAGTVNLCNAWANGEGLTLVHGYETFAIHGMAERKLVGAWSAFGELTYANDRMRSTDVGMTLSNVLVPANNLFNPFGQAVRVQAMLGPDNGAQGFARQTKFTRALAGLRGELTQDWDAEITVSTVQDRGGSQTLNASLNSTALAAALAAQNPSDALNPFTSGRAASDSVLRGIWTDTVRRSQGRRDQLAGQVRGPVWQLPAGPVEAIVGAETARDWYDVSITRQTEVHNSRRSAAAYGELRAPLWSGTEAGRGGWTLAALTLAGRRDHYSDFGSASTYQAGFELRPTRSLLLRASTASSFKPPTMLQTNVNTSTFAADLFGLVDPARGREAITTGTVVRSANSSLEPEKGKAQGIGMVWEPEGGLGTRLGFTHWRVRINGLIALLQPQTALDYEAAFPGFVTRGPSVGGQPGPVTSVRYAEANLGRVESAGTDLEASYAWRGSLGRLTLGAGATRTSEYRVLLAPGTPMADRLGRRFSDYWAPRWKGRVSAGFDRGAWSVAMTSRYLGSYLDSGSSNRRLGNYLMHDLSGSLNLKKLWPGLASGFKGAALSMSIANLTDREPQFVETAPYYDVTQADWRGRYVGVKLALDW